MGFLDVNVPRATRTRRLRRAPAAAKSTGAGAGAGAAKRRRPARAVVEDVPAELLQRVLVLSGNLALAQASRALARKLRRTPELELRFLRARVEARGGARVLPTAHLRLPFLTHRLLQRLEPLAFDSEFVPVHLEDARDRRCRRLVAYMLRAGCRLENSRQSYRRLFDAGQWRQAARLARARQRCDVDLVATAARAGQDRLARALLPLAGELGPADVARLRALPALAEALLAPKPEPDA